MPVEADQSAVGAVCLPPRQDCPAPTGVGPDWSRTPPIGRPRGFFCENKWQIDGIFAPHDWQLVGRTAI